MSDVFAGGSDAFEHDAADGSIVDSADSSSSPDGMLDGNLDGGDTEASALGDAAATGTVLLSDCQDGGCAFPGKSASPCLGAPPLTIVYPPDGVLVPPNMGIIDVQWTPNGTPYSTFEVDFSNGNTDWRMITKCSSTYQTADLQADGGPSGGCYVSMQDTSWSRVSSANRVSGSSPVEITVRGTTNGQCATVSNLVHLSFAEQDVAGSYYYWKSTVTSNGVGGQIWRKIFGDLSTKEQDVTSNVATPNGTLTASCNGCHALSRDGSRMVIYSDDSDSDDEYSDIGGSFLDMTPLANGGTPHELGDSGLTGMGFSGAGGGQPPGFTTIHPSATSYITSNGLPMTDAGPAMGGFPTNGGYPTNVPANAFTIWDGNGNFRGSFAVGAATDRPTMPDWSIDGTSVIYVVPQSVATYDQSGFFGTRTDDDHIFGGSLYTMPYNGNGTFGTGTPFLMSGGENNFYPSYSPDSTATEAGLQPPTFVLFDRVANNSDAGTNCDGGFCPNDSFSNPAARLMLMLNKAMVTPIDLEKANGSGAASPIALSNSYPRWAPFVQTYKGNKILWFTFSSTRDYGLRILNHKSGMYQCYPADAAETPGGMHAMPFDPNCQEPQLWMAAITYSGNSLTADPSSGAFWIPYQDMTTHNHMAQWTQ